MAPSQPKPIHRRLFVVGCSRSGTTLAQRFLEAHSRVHSFPETGVFLRALGMRGRLLPWVRLGLTAGKERRALERLLTPSKGGEGPKPDLPPHRILLRRSISDVVGVLDELAALAEADVWVEKTPRHVFHAIRITKMVPRSVCIHMVRDGRDVVASVVDRARRFPDRFPRQREPNYGIRQWNRSMAATEAAMRRKGQVAVLYEALASDPETTLRTLCRALGLEYEDTMLDPPADPVFVTEDEPWKSQVTGPVSPARSKFAEVFDDATGVWIQDRLNRGFFREIEERTSGESGGVWVSGEGL
ncbi:sulfotransferase [Gemmatimonadota bacterium]